MSLNCKTLGTLSSALTGSNIAITPSGIYVAVATVTFTQKTGRRLLVTYEGDCNQQANQAVGNIMTWHVTEGGGELTGSLGVVEFGTAQTHNYTLTHWFFIAPTAGNHTYQLEARCASGTFTGQVNQGTLLLVEDIGT